MNKINLKNIKMFNKYNYYLYSNNKIYFLFSNNSLKNSNKKINKLIKNKKINNCFLIIASFNKVSKKVYNLNKKSKLKTIGGPLYIRLTKYRILLKNKIKFVKKIQIKFVFKKYITKI